MWLRHNDQLETVLLTSLNESLVSGQRGEGCIVCVCVGVGGLVSGAATAGSRVLREEHWAT